jgi:general secretion pathway protein D
MKITSVRLVSLALAFMAMSSCATTPEPVSGRVTTTTDSAVVSRSQDGDQTPEVIAGNAGDLVESTNEDRSNIVLGSGTFVQAARGSRANAYATDDGVTLNFEQADLKEFLRVVFETILRENYLIDPQVGGTVTLHTTRPITRDAVLPILETVLQGNGAALVRDEGIFNIVPMADAETIAGAPAVGRYASNRTRGYGIQVVPLEHVAAAEIQKIVGPFVPDGSALRIDEARNVLILSGPQYRIDELLATIRTFDVDWLKGMSFAMFRLQYADAAILVDELEGIIDGQGPTPLSGIVRLLPIERLNAVLVIAHRPDHIAEVQRLVEQLDWGVEGSFGRRLFVYELEYGKAENIANALQVIFGESGDETSLNGATGMSGSDVFRSAEELSHPPPEPGATLNVVSGPASDGFLAESQGEIKIIADSDNNAILILASQQDYRAIEAAIRRLDIAPRQVLIEATIAEVTLSNTLDHGVRWFLQNSNNEIGFNAPVPSTASGAGLAFAFFDDSSDLSAFFDMLATESQVKFLSTPQVMVLDNQTATIRVGDQIPVTTRSSQSTTNPDAPIVTEVQFRDTGTLLTVTPRINAGGQVTLEISQEVSLPGTEPAVGGGGNVSIAQRTINSSVIVQSGQTVVLGGLILENTIEGRSGIPILMNIPLLGKLFSSTSEDVFRTELIVTVTPRVIENQRAMQQVTEELRARMKKASEYEDLVNQANGGL